VDSPSVMGNEGDLPQRRYLAVLFKLLASVVGLGARAQDLDDHGGIQDRALSIRIALQRPADDGDVGISGEAGGQDTDAKVRSVDTTRLPVEWQIESRRYLNAQSRVLGRPPRHGENVARQKFQLHVRGFVEREVLGERVAVSWRG